ncbi:glycosyltransferase [Pseudomonas huanghezhanensis]|uniref:glycosyltransferase n=1 Tax=Pseudomonas huanghezhanensis TaxID=3002903 RepID=UPI0022865577|nr:glycosyltransferase [Pseudomonas sp. BSw22131]
MVVKLTFVIPVRHPANSKDWEQNKRNISETVKSIVAQHGDDWAAVIVANEGADLPPLPARIQVKRVDFAPNPLHEKSDAGMAAFYDAVRLDKGRRVLAGMLHVAPTDYFMIVDDDDFLSNKLVDFVSTQPLANGWYINNGFVWSEGTRWVYLHPEFNEYCGTSYIVRADLMNLPASFDGATDEYVKQLLGSHKFIKPLMAENGTPLSPLPFPGAVYRVGHAGAHSKSNSVVRTFLLNKTNVRSPAQLLASARKFRWVNASMNSEFTLPL